MRRRHRLLAARPSGHAQTYPDKRRQGYGGVSRVQHGFRVGAGFLDVAGEATAFLQAAHGLVETVLISTGTLRWKNRPLNDQPWIKTSGRPCPASS